MLLTYTKNDGYLCLHKNHERDPLQAMVRLPIENTGYPSYTSLWEIEKKPVTEISPFPDKKKQIGTEGTYTLRDLLSGEYLKVFPFQKLGKKDLSSNVFQNIKFEDDEITIKSAKGMTNPADYIKHNGLVKISGPKKAALIKNG